MDNKLERLKARTEDAVNTACFIGFIVRETAKMTLFECRKWHPDYINSPKAVAKGTAVYYEDLWLCQKIIGRFFKPR